MANKSKNSDKITITPDAFELLRLQVDQLQIDVSEKKKPWYQQSSIVLSLIALALSTAFSLFTVIDQLNNRREEEIEKKLESLRQIILQIYDTKKDWLAAASNAEKDLVNYMRVDRVASSQRQILLERADAIIKNIEPRVSTNIFISLGSEAQNDSLFEKAKIYYEIGLKRSEITDAQKINIHSSLGSIFMTPGIKLHNISSGREHFNDAISLVSGEDELSYEMRGRLLASLAVAEFNNKNRQMGFITLNKAKAEIEKMDQNNPQRRYDLIGIKSIFELNSNPAKVSFFNQLKDLTEGLLGDWEIQYDDDFMPVCKAIFLPNQDHSGLIVSIDGYINNMFVKKLSGSGTLLDSNTLRIDWAGGTIAMDGFKWVQEAGMMNLSKKNGKWSGVDFILGGKSTKITLRRLNQ
jgi:hypothetical protein